MSIDQKAREVISLIDYVTTKKNIRIQINQLPVPVIRVVADHYGLHVFEPEEHPLKFTFCKGYLKEGKVVVGKRNADGSFSLSDIKELPEEVFL